jgi:23S rRNA (uracil1939-C5)-methyltransferase
MLPPVEREAIITCPHCPPCGGCPLLGVPVAKHPEIKRAAVAAALGRYPSLRGVEVRPCLPAPSPTGYRTRAKLAVHRLPGADRAAIGLFAPGTHDVVDIPGCRVLHPALLPILGELRELLARTDLDVAHVDLRWARAASRAHVTLVVGGEADPVAARALAEELLAARPEVGGVGLRRAPGGKVIRAVGGVTEAVAGDPFLVEELGGARFRLSPGAFFQNDPAAAELLLGVVRDWLFGSRAGRAGTLVDLYAGVGVFAICLGREAKTVVAVEPVPAAAADALENAALNRAGLRVVVETAERSAGGEALGPSGRLVLDPPRRGASLAVLEGIALAAPGRAAYVSCDPETLARDLDALGALGIDARVVVPLDLFALGNGVECVALLEPAGSLRRPALLWRGAGALAVEKPAALATHPQRPGLPSLLDAVREAEGRSDLQPAHRLDLGTSGPVLFAAGAELRRLGRLFAERKVEKHYLALVRGVPRQKGIIRDRDGGVTRYRLEDVVGGYGLVRARPETGRQHQVRRHLASLGHPILGDERYGEQRANRFLAETCALARPFLHLSILAFEAADGDAVSLESPLPPELRLVLERLEALRGSRDR